ncbi:hypothetical protein FA13DRAFT_1796102 [Coprinellus micaceus]|uniref:Uncharacterized protein n=1 Tax=Coprinellus micaceus TaxID=71717 RepID=A0A4Y7SVY2_COPMI|nr:hypothetical protein FA13DRAFT_1796102 [Coprinellus micaceus]
MDDFPLFGDFSIHHFYLIGCFLEQCCNAFLAHVMKKAAVITEREMITALFLREMDIAIELNGYQKCLQPEMSPVPSFSRIVKAITLVATEELSPGMDRWKLVWELLSRGSLLPHVYIQCGAEEELQKNGPWFTICPWWTSPYRKPTRKTVLREFSWAKDNIQMGFPRGVSDESLAHVEAVLVQAREDIDNESLAADFRVVCTGIRLDNAVTRLAMLTDIYRT